MFVKDTLHAGPVVLSVMLGAWGVGSVAGMVAYNAVNKRFKLPLGTTLIVLSLGIALPLWIPPLTQAVVPAAAGFLLAGLSDGPLTVLLHTMQQTETPAEIRGRVFSAIRRTVHDRRATGRARGRAGARGRGSDPLDVRDGGDVHGGRRARLAVADHPPGVNRRPAGATASPSRRPC